jgi:ATP-dependent DNA helicase RecG
MIDSIGSGIKRMFRVQRERFFPMPDYDFSGNKVKITLTGKVLDVDYARVLARNPELSLDEIILLDKVQKRKPLLETELKSLRSKGLIEGKKPNIIVSAKVAQTTGQKATYTRNKAFTKQQYFDWIIQGIKDHGSLSRQDIEGLLMAKLSDLYDSKQKKNKITNLISELRMKGIIRNDGTDLNSKWVLVNP